MIPSLVVNEIRSALIEYLASTFALSNDEVRHALSDFLQDEADGIFRGPYLKVRTPFRPVGQDWVPPLDWLPDGFVPYEHQAKSFERLSTLDGRVPSPTLVTTGTGSGKTECFLYPVLDHCARMRADGRQGVKAILLYPMNALATDQASRIASIVDSETRLAGLTAGLYVGEAGRHSGMSATNIIDKREVLRADPPDILLTNYKMLDFLLLRQEDRDLWAVNDSTTLQYIVLDEFHTYDGAQGTDVAMLLRRLGATLQMATDDRPLGTATPVATSATLGSGTSALVDLRSFANKVFGVEFDDDSVIGETRQSVEEACRPTKYTLPIPEVADLVGIDDFDDIVAAFCFPIDPEDNSLPDSDVALGMTLLEHPLTRAVLRSVGDYSRTWPDALAEIVAFAPSWGRDLATTDGTAVAEALTKFLWLMSAARRGQGGKSRPLFSVEVQLWSREVSRMLRAVDTAPSFRWRDSSVMANEDAQPPTPGSELPAIYCRRCGMSGWMAVASETSDAYSVTPSTVYNAAISRSPLVRSMMSAHPDDADCQWYSVDQRCFVDGPGDRVVPVLVTKNEDDARANRCPGCDERDAIRFIGSAVASMASVSINTLFGSTHLDHHERKLLAFTDSVQDASHRAGFFGGRTHRINLRSLMARIIQRDGQVALADLGDLLLAEAETAQDRFGLVPPDLIRHPIVKKSWADTPGPGSLEMLATRLGFEVDLEFGLRSRVGRTLELTQVAAAEVQLDDFDTIASLLGEEIERVTGERREPLALAQYLRGLLERIRLRGGLTNELLEPFVESGGKQWFIWGGRPDGLPPFTPGQGRPSFFTTAAKGELDSVTVAPGPNPTWVNDWAVRALGLDPSTARNLNAFTLALLAKETDVVTARSAGSSTVYGLDRRSILIHDIGGDGDHPVTSHLQCPICGNRHVAPPSSIDDWIDAPCLRHRCVGRYTVANTATEHYYRKLYRQGVVRRVVTGEHTGLLGRAAREDLEIAFKAGTAADAPNVLTATPTLEMGIDIGDLSAVMLTSVPRSPASYIQRVGRAGRATGNALVTTFVRTDTHGLYYLADPDAMIAGDVRPPDCFLDAVETLQRQYIAYLIDRIADQTIDAPVMPRQISGLIKSVDEEGSFLSAVIKASMLDPDQATRFLALFGNQISDVTTDRLRSFASSGIATAVKDAAEAWKDQERELGQRRTRLTGAIDKLEAAGDLGHEDEVELSNLRGQRAAVAQLLTGLRNEYSISALERLGLLPNYSLVDDATTLTAAMWARSETGAFETEVVEYKRSGRMAIREFAPGNSFYASGHRHMIDALEIGSASEPLYEQWRLCPDCGYAAPESQQATPKVCPRCQGQSIADNGALHLMLRLRGAFASGSEENARVFDDLDDRRRERYEIVTAVDVDSSDVSGAWELPDKAFGAEFAERTHIRTINTGLAERSGETVPIAGQDHHVTRYTVCAHCGAVKETRDDRDGTRPEKLHQGWCKVRSGAVKAKWDSILLFHELTTESIRMVLPVSMFEVEERLASFKGALLLGLREELGGNPEHLEVVLANAPNRSGQGRKQFLMLFDAVPGGTGYLAPLVEPGHLKTILEKGRSLIAHCACTTEGRSACHRCLLGVVDRNEYDLVRRDLAIEILDELLADWAPKSVDTVGNIDIAQVEESELERRFKIALRAWADSIPDDIVSFSTVPGKGKFGAFELRININGIETRYRINEQAGLSTTPSSIPDYLIQRMDANAPEVAVFLDGYQFHASPKVNNIAADALKRRAARQSGRLVWNMVWNDVDAFHNAVQKDPPKEPPHLALVRGQARTQARKVHQDRNGLFDIDALNQNALALLLDYLSRPEAEHWQRLVISAVTGLAASAQERAFLSTESIRHSALGAIRGEALPPTDAAESPAAIAQRVVTPSDLPMTLYLDSRRGTADERWTVVASLDDSLAGDEELHRGRWQDWLHWANILQFLGGPGREAIIAATSEADDFPIDDHFIVDIASTGDSSTADGERFVVVSDFMVDELDLLEDAEVEVLVRSALERGAPDFVAGADVIVEVLEAAWPAARVAVLRNDQAFADDSWDARPARDWTVDELVTVIAGRMNQEQR